jgi:hypothetical protein
MAAESRPWNESGVRHIPTYARNLFLRHFFVEINEPEAI